MSDRGTTGGRGAMRAAPPRSGIGRVGATVLVLAALAIVAPLLLLTGVGAYVILSDPPPPDRAAVERFLKLPLPRGADGFAARADHGIDLRIQATFEAPEAEARAFAERLVGEALTPGYDPGVAAPGTALAGWPAEAPPGHAGGQRLEPGRAYHVLAVPAAAGRTRLFVVGFEL